MPYRKVTIYLTVQDLCKKLQISHEVFHDVEEKIKHKNSKEWNLKEGKHYRVAIKKTGLREYTELGAYLIIDYLQQEYYKDKNIFTKILVNVREWITGLKREIKQYCVRQRITYNSSSLIRRRDEFWLSCNEVARVFETRPDYLKKVHEKMIFDDILEQSPMLKLTDRDYYDDIDSQIRYYSISGIQKLAGYFSKSLTPKPRKSWCNDVGNVVKEQINSIVEDIKKREKDIQKAKEYVREIRDNKRCQITKEKQYASSEFQLAVHHLYSRHEYPHLADDITNLITIKQSIHNQFHDQYMGGKNKPCTIKDFLDFIHSYYPQNTELILYLEKCNLTLGDPKPIHKLGIDVPRVLYLPISRVT